MSDGGGFGIVKKGPDRYIGQPLRFFGMDAYSAVGIVPIIIFPFSSISWSIAGVILVVIYIASRFRLPSYQLFRFLSVRMGRRLVPPNMEQLDRARWSARRWPL
jgi:hypothetical protein